MAKVDAEGRFLRVNDRLCELMGYVSEELLGRSIFDETYADDVLPDRDQLRRQPKLALRRGLALIAGQKEPVTLFRLALGLAVSGKQAQA